MANPRGTKRRLRAISLPNGEYRAAILIKIREIPVRYDLLAGC